MATEGSGRKLKRLRKKVEVDANVVQVECEVLKEELVLRAVDNVEFLAAEDPDPVDLDGNPGSPDDENPVEGRMSADLEEDDADLERKSAENVAPTGKEKKPKGKHDAVCSRKSKKAYRKEAEEIHTESQRLLRETKEAAFEAAPTVHVSMSGLLSKLRARKLQLGWKNVANEERYTGSSAPQVSNCEDETNEAADQSTSFQHDLIQDETTTQDTALDNLYRSEDLPVKYSDMYRNCSQDFQDHTSDSQLAPDEVEDDSSDRDADMENQPHDFGRSTNSEQENLLRKVEGFSTKPQIMALIDDEAEVEDEDLLQKDDDDDEDNSAELLEIIGGAEPEEPLDISTRAELHRQWLEQQDEAQTDDILCRIQGNSKAGGGTGKFSSFLDAEDTIIPEVHTNGSEFKADDKMTDRMTDELDNDETDSEQRLDPITSIHVLEQEEDNALREYSDDEETERVILKQQVLEAAERQELFISPAEDESSRELLSIIKKTNVIITAKAKAKTLQATDMRGTTALHSCKSTFLNRAASLSSSSVHKPVISASSKSFIFGRDDSNSSSSRGLAASLVTDQTTAAKENSAPKSIPVDVSESRGPSLFSILKQNTSVAHQTTVAAEQVLIADRLAIFANFSKKRKL